MHSVEIPGLSLAVNKTLENSGKCEFKMKCLFHFSAQSSFHIIPTLINRHIQHVSIKLAVKTQAG